MNANWREIVRLILIAIAAALGASAPITVYSCGGGTIPTFPDPDKGGEEGPKDPWNAIGKIAMKGGYCSGTVVGPRMSDGRWRIVSAAHCFKQVGEPAQFIQRDGVARPITVIAIDRRADIAICSTDTGQGKMAWTDIASSTPAAGTQIWHGGYGRHIPGNKETGTVVSGPNGDGQVKYRLSVSPGDSGGGIVIDGNGLLLSPVCCTTRLDGPGEVWGGSPEQIRRMIATPTDYIDLPPIEMPPPPQEMPAKAP